MTNLTQLYRAIHNDGESSFITNLLKGNHGITIELGTIASIWRTIILYHQANNKVIPGPPSLGQVKKFLQKRERL